VKYHLEKKKEQDQEIKSEKKVSYLRMKYFLMRKKLYLIIKIKKKRVNNGINKNKRMNQSSEKLIAIFCQV
jgi:hypothetical protein